MSDKHILADLSRRRLILGAVSSAVALAAASPASAQYRRRDPYNEPYGSGAEDDLWQGRGQSRTPPRDTFYDTQVQQDYYIRDPSGSGRAPR